MTIDLFSRTTHSLRSNGGDVDVFVRMKRAGKREAGERINVDEASVQVTLTVPIMFVGKQFNLVVSGAYVSEEPWSCYSRLHQRAKIESCADTAMKCAIERLEEEIPKLLREARPTVSNKKVERKTQAVMKLLKEARL